MKAVNVDEVLKILYEYGRYIFVTDEKKYSSMVDEIANLKPFNSQPTGHWVEEITNEGGRKVFCSECGCPPPFEHISSGDVYSASGYGVINKTKFCPNCGTKMESEEKDE